MKTFLFLFLFSLSFNCISQSKRISKIEKNINEGSCSTISESCKNKNFKYLKDCKKVGNYYYKWGKYEGALRYYRKAFELDVSYNVNPKLNKFSKLRNKLCLKAGRMYLSGLGTKKDTLEAFYFYTVDTFSLIYTQEKYSKLFLGNKEYYYSNFKDTIFECGINPFYISESFSYLHLMDYLNKVITTIKKNKFKTCKIQISYGLLKQDSTNTNYLKNILNSIDSYLGANCKDKYTIEIIPRNIGYLYKSLTLPKITSQFITVN